MIFTRRDHAGDHPPRHGGRVVQDAVDAEAHAQLAAVGLEVDVGGALLDGLGDDPVDELDDRRVVGRLAQVDDLGRPVLLVLSIDRRLATTSSRRVRRATSAGDVLARGDRRAHVEPVISAMSSTARTLVGSAIATSSAAVADEGDRHRLVAAWRRRRGSGSPPPCRRRRALRSRWSRP